MELIKLKKNKFIIAALIVLLTILFLYLVLNTLFLMNENVVKLFGTTYYSKLEAGHPLGGSGTIYSCDGTSRKLLCKPAYFDNMCLYSCNGKVSSRKFNPLRDL